VARALLKAPKYYFYDNGMVQGDQGCQLENLTACALLKEVQRRCDIEGDELSLHYVRNKDGIEVDFLLTRRKRPCLMIEVKWKDDSLSPNFRKLIGDTNVPCIQVVGELKRSKSFPTGERVVAAREYLAALQFPKE
jgi:predicted AAA+ superfamily ATPase